MEDMALLVGSRWRGSRVMVSSSMLGGLILGQAEVSEGERFFLRGLIAWVYVAGAVNVLLNSSKRTPRMEINVQCVYYGMSKHTLFNRLPVSLFM